MMMNPLESSIKQLIKEVANELATEILKEIKFLETQKPKVTPLGETALLLTPRETAKRLGVSERHLFRITHEGVLPHLKIGRNTRYNIETVKEWIRSTEATIQTKFSNADGKID